MLINCAAYENGQKLADISVEEIHAYISRPDCFVWIALKDPEPSELERMQKEFGLHELAVEDAQHGHQRPKIEEYGESLFVVLHMIEFAGDELTVGETDIFVGQNYVLSVRRQAKRGFVDVRERCEREPELMKHGTGYVLYALMDAVVDRYFPILDDLETNLERIEERIFANQSSRANIEDLYELKRKLTVLKHATEPLVTAISVNLSLITVQENEITKRLGSYAALITMPTLIAGIYGMNFEHMPELSSLWGYPLTLITMVIVDLYLFFRFRKAGWL